MEGPSIADNPTPRDTTLNITKLLNMLNFQSSTGFQGSGYVILNGLRAINIFVLATTAAACFLMMIFAKLPNAFQFFTDINLVFIAGVCFLLVWTELPFQKWKGWINRTWPVFAEKRHGFTWLGLTMFMMGCHTLGKLSNEPYTKKTIGTPVWRIIAASGCLSIAFGAINVLVSLLYRNSESGVFAREVRSKGATTRDYDFPDDGYSSRSDSVRKEKTRSRLFAKFSKPTISRPIPHDVEHGRSNELPPVVVVEDDRSSPIVPQLKRPPTALHPAINGGPRSSFYSEASHLNRFDENRF